MRLLLDEMHSPAAAVALREQGVDATAVAEDAALRGLADGLILSVAAAAGRAFVTENVRDFLPVARAWASDGRQHAGVVLTSPATFPRGARSYPKSLVAALRAFVEVAPPPGDSWVWWLSAPR